MFVFLRLRYLRRLKRSQIYYKNMKICKARILVNNLFKFFRKIFYFSFIHKLL